MDKSLNLLCETIKKISAQLPTRSPLSLIILTGKMKQGKTTLLKQSSLNYAPIDGETEANLFYNNQGIILELGETWLNQQSIPLAHSLKKINRSQKILKISGIILTIDCSELVRQEPLHLNALCQSHIQLLERFGQALGYSVDAAIFFTKLDSLAGFCEFFQADHPSELLKPLGFSLDIIKQKNKLLSNYKIRFDHMIEALGQQIINKLHPVRSSTKRSLIREFPLQLALLRRPLQTLIQKIPTSFFRLQALFFMSAEQGGLSIDCLNKKIEHEYALIVQDKFPQSHNFRPYFIEGALSSFQLQTQFMPAQDSKQHQVMMVGALACTAVLFSFLIYKHFQTARLLDEASKELITYETLINEAQNNTAAFYHLSLAETKLNAIHGNLLPLPLVSQLRMQLHHNTEDKLSHHFLPDFVSRIESVMIDPMQSPLNRYQALKIYLMLTEPNHFSEPEVIHWYSQYWNTINPNNLDDRPLVVLQSALKLPLQPIPAKKQLIMDVRNYLNALPASYLYYSLAKGFFSTEKDPIAIDGFELPVRELPVYYTKAGFNDIIHSLAAISTTLQQENWVLERQDLDNLQMQLEQAYCFEYITWWQNFINRVQPRHYQGYQQARQLMQSIVQSKSIPRLVEFIQLHTKPEENTTHHLFNHKIANHFTDINLITPSASNDLSDNLYELEQFLTTLSLVHDQGKTLFNLTKARFQGSQSDPLSKLYNRALQVPTPVSKWVKQMADDSWYIFISASKHYLNQRWQKEVYQNYESTIANRYPVNTMQQEEVSMENFNHFFAPHGILNSYVNNYLKPFLDMSQPQWQAKELNGYLLPISNDLLNELIRANIISNMFFPNGKNNSNIEFSLQKINLDPVIAKLELSVGNIMLTDNQSSDSYTSFKWPEANAKLMITSIDGHHFSLEESGVWAFFKILQKVSVLVDNNDSSSLQILFEINGNSGRYLLKTENQINPFSPGVLTGFNLNPNIA